MKQLYKDIAYTLKSNLGCFVDIWNGQTSRQNEQHPLFLPAVFVEFKTATVLKSKNGVQQLRVEITMHVVQEIYADSFEGAETQEKALEVLDFLEQVYVCMQDLQGIDYSPLERKTTRFDSNYTNMIAFELDFITVLQDSSKQNADERLLVEPILEPQRTY
jgi:hypothetical protein